jgi:hypothetical protein
MAKQSFVLDPNAQSYSDDQIVGKINTATAQITRAASVASVARPIGSGEVTNTELASGVAKSNLDAMSDTDRSYIKTDPAAGQFKIISIERQADGKMKADYDDVAA